MPGRGGEVTKVEIHRRRRSGMRIGVSGARYLHKEHFTGGSSSMWMPFWWMHWQVRRWLHQIVTQWVESEGCTFFRATTNRNMQLSRFGGLLWASVRFLLAPLKRKSGGNKHHRAEREWLILRLMQQLSVHAFSIDILSSMHCEYCTVLCSAQPDAIWLWCQMSQFDQSRNCSNVFMNVTRLVWLLHQNRELN